MRRTIDGMGRWEPNSADRLVDAALELFAHRGYDRTTAKDIAKAAGLTERTFFRYFPDKREVLFVGVDGLQAQLVGALDATPPETAPIDAVTVALEALGALLGGRRDFAARRHAVIAASPELTERELIKLARFAAALTDALWRRGTPAGEAALVAEAGMTIFRVAFDRWIAGEDDTDLAAVIRSTRDELGAVTATVQDQPR